MNEPTLFDDFEDDAPSVPASPFDAIKHEDEQGEYWLAREIWKTARYSTWQRFEGLISRAQEVFADRDRVNLDVNPVSSMVGNGQTVKDYRCTRHGAYMILSRSDKPELAEYFVQQTMYAEAVQAQPVLESEDDIVLRAVDILQRRVATAEAKVAELEPAAEAYHGFLDSEGLINLSDGWRRIRTVHPLKMPEYFGLLRAWDVVFTTSGESTLKSWFTDKGYGRNIDITYEGNSGGHHRLQGKLTPAGVDYLLDRFGRFQRGITDGREGS